MRISINLDKVINILLVISNVILVIALVVVCLRLT